MNKRVAVLFLLGGFASANAGEVRLIRCTGTQPDGTPASIEARDGAVTVVPQGGARVVYRVTLKKVERAGVTARNVYRLEKGEFSFHEEYGCILSPKFAIEDKEMTALSCVYQGAQPCPQRSES